MGWNKHSRNLGLLLLCLWLAACTPSLQTDPIPTHTPSRSATAAATLTILPSFTPTTTPSPTPQPRETPRPYGPELEDFPPGINPLTALRVSEPALLEQPAALISISNMPVTTRPQAGLQFASWVFELFIGEGTTRFLAVFYGEYPRYIPNLPGGCPVRPAGGIPTEPWLGGRAWLDENENGRFDPWEAGVGGLCLHLYDAADQLLQSIATDSNGYYFFNLPAGGEYRLKISPSPYYQLTAPHQGTEEGDSDLDPQTGASALLSVSGGAHRLDLGLILLPEAPPTPTPSITPTPTPWYIPNEAYVGPIRSGRLTYNHIYAMFPFSCLVYSGAGRGIREVLHGCEIAYGVDLTTPNSALLTVSRMRQLTAARKPSSSKLNYSGNLFDPSPPAGGQPANSLHVFYHAYTQSAWVYDPLSGAYLRYTDQADGSGTLVPALDRLTGRQQLFENIIVLLADYQWVRHLQFDVQLGIGQGGRAWLLRDGRIYPIRWSTANREWERKTGLPRPIHFTDAQGNLMPLKPGHTWIHLMTPNSALRDLGNGAWQAFFVQPPDPRPGEN